jgi:hypothetical protein
MDLPATSIEWLSHAFDGAIAGRADHALLEVGVSRDESLAEAPVRDAVALAESADDDRGTGAARKSSDDFSARARILKACGRTERGCARPARCATSNASAAPSATSR